jgi:dTDP-4-amino-4,6-dideoxygalactose transaminase
MKVPIMNIGIQYKQLEEEIDRAMKDIVQSSRFVLGRETEDFEKDVCSYCNVKCAIGVASGTDALILTLTALGIKMGDEVITTPFTFTATAEAIARVGAKPVFVDIDPRTYNMNPAKIEGVITSNTKAIIPVHLYGNPCDMNSILKIAEGHGLRVIEDAAQAIGATYDNRKIGSFGDSGCFSFFPSKNLGAFGDGGMILTNNGKLAEKLRSIRVHGTTSKYRHSLVGFNSRLDNLQAAILSIKLKKLDEWTEARRKIGKRYNSALKDIVIIPQDENKGKHVYHLYIVRVKGKRRDGLLEFLNENGVESRVYYPVPLHLQECYKTLGYKEGDFPEVERASLETLALPLFPGLEEEQQDYVVETVKKYFK